MAGFGRPRPSVMRPPGLMGSPMGAGGPMMSPPMQPRRPQTPNPNMRMGAPMRSPGTAPRRPGRPGLRQSRPNGR